MAGWSRDRPRRPSPGTRSVCPPAASWSWTWNAGWGPTSGSRPEVGETVGARGRRWLAAVGRSVWRIGWPRTDKDRTAVMISSLFLHLHPARVSRHSVRPGYTVGLGLGSVVTFGVVLRNMHRWSAHAMVVIVFVNMCRVFWTGSYKEPREFNWVVGVG